jgi:hypothetical protein
MDSKTSAMESKALALDSDGVQSFSFGRALVMESKTLALDFLAFD